MLDGEQSLVYSRYSNTDKDALEKNRQIEVVVAIVEKIVKLGTNKIWDLSDSVLSQIKTNIDINKSVETIEKILSYSSEYINSFDFIQIPSTEDEYGSGKYEEINGNIIMLLI